MRIYADFNATVDPGGLDRLGLVRLDRLGTLRDLCAARVRLTEGLPLVLYMDSDLTSDIEIEAVGRWISDPGGLDGGFWVGEYDPKGFRDVPILASESVAASFPCSSCGANLAEQIARSGLSATTCCSRCGVSVHWPLRPPERGDGHDADPPSPRG